MHFIDFIKLDMHSYGNFYNHKSVITATFCQVYGFDLGKDAFILRWMKGQEIELPP